MPDETRDLGEACARCASGYYAEVNHRRSRVKRGQGWAGVGTTMHSRNETWLKTQALARNPGTWLKTPPLNSDSAPPRFAVTQAFCMQQQTATASAATASQCMGSEELSRVVEKERAGNILGRETRSRQGGSRQRRRENRAGLVTNWRGLAGCRDLET